MGREFGYIILGGQTLAEAETAPLPAGPANRSSAHFLGGPPLGLVRRSSFGAGLCNFGQLRGGDSESHGALHEDSRFSAAAFPAFSLSI